ncbi:LLM class flavin-dependent oxidoreductase [bacterium]|nr:MAG: LLM class flavin-dependent oxidoreductase [bacterium]
MLRVGVKLPATIGRPGEYLADVTALEAGGADTIWLHDTAVQPGAGSHVEPQLQPWVLAAAMAAVTRRVRLGIAFPSVAAWPPALFAATVIAFDQLSGNRLVLGFGLEESGGRLEEFLQVLKLLCSGSGERFDGRFYQLPSVRLARGARPEGPPILIASPHGPARDGLRSIANGIIQPGSPPEGLRADPGGGEVWVEIPIPPDREAWGKTLAAYETAGATGVIVSWEPRIVDLLRNTEPDDRTDLLVSTG